MMMEANDYQLPGANRITFSNELADEIKDTVKKLREEEFFYRKIHKEVPHISLSSIGNILKEVTVRSICS